MEHETTQGFRIETDLARQHYALCDAGHFADCCLHPLPMHPQLSSRRVYLLVWNAWHSHSPRSPIVGGGGG